MNLNNACVLLTGASGGIGRELALELARRGAHLLLSGRDAGRLETLRAELQKMKAPVTVLRADLADAQGAQALADATLAQGTPDIVIHCAGRMSFGALEDSSAEAIEHLWHTNVIAPMLLTRALLPALRQRGSGRLIFVGSIFGSLAFPLYASYSASKFALRGFAEALRRELAGSGIGVTYVAPRYTRTALNAGAPERIAAATKMAQDEPNAVAARIVDAIAAERRELFFGWAERWFVRINAWFPALLDRALGAQATRMRALTVPPP